MGFTNTARIPCYTPASVSICSSHFPSVHHRGRTHRESPLIYRGDGRIRTCGPLRVNALAERRFKPLSHVPIKRKFASIAYDRIIETFKRLYPLTIGYQFELSFRD